MSGAKRTARFLLLMLLGVGCARAPHEPVRTDDLSVVLVVLDAAGARYVGAYGNRLPTSPNLDALARDGGALFERAYAQSAWTLPSTAGGCPGHGQPSRRR